ncbi:uncharacterized protein BJ171DRAFT_503633 [Polychytrium aggregatum]|uniref:uncharacterized protein n=1 Tax=Polychytrium aggregatum TaxID=110093 RepID=UPI0022FE7653|nr:uncharacterized protein BJ171DRAFT_503633 [Polychytrium aggregatum]KAI9204790.1 hypothetical protein BJ171DRAFT_503633 [Polychytrium aggregatum]
MADPAQHAPADMPDTTDTLSPTADFASSPDQTAAVGLPIRRPVVRLPSEIVMTILHFARLCNKDISSCCLVSRSWNACATPMLYRSIRNEKALLSVLTPVLLEPNGFHSRLAMVRSLSLQGFRGGIASQRGSLEIMFYKLHRLQKLVLEDYFDECFESLPPVLSSPLRITELEVRVWWSTMIEHLISFLKNTPRLRKLTFTAPKLIEHHFLRVLESCGSSLEELSMGGDLWMNPIGSLEFAARLPERCPNLSILTLSHCTLLTDTSLRLLLSKLGGRLQTLNIQFVPQLTDQVIAAIPHTSPNLVSLRLYDFPNITEPAVASLLKSSGSLRHLSLGFLPIGDSSLRAIAAHGHHLETLEFYECNVLFNIASLWADQSLSLTNLTALRLSWCRSLRLVEEDTSPATDALVSQAAPADGTPHRSCAPTPNAVTGCNELLERVYLPHLEHLEIKYCNSLAPADMLRLVSRCPDLKWCQVIGRGLDKTFMNQVQLRLQHLQRVRKTGVEGQSALLKK